MFRLPTIRTPEEILDSAFKRANKVSVAKMPRGKKLAEAKQLSVGKVKTMVQYVSEELATYVKGFPSFDRLHDFYKELIDVTVGLDALKHHLGALDRCRKVGSSIGSAAVGNIKRAVSAAVIEKERKGAYGRVSSLLRDSSKNLEFLRNAGREMGRMPEIDPGLKTIVIAGYPNVGKSQLVMGMSSARPKIASYPFTTENISVGIFEEAYRRYQVIDTPGLLDRPYDRRNRIERKAISALRHLASAIVFVFDPTETCGYPLESQLRLLESVRRDFMVPIIEVENKLDILRTPTPRMKVSALTGEGMEELRDRILSLLRKES